MTLTRAPRGHVLCYHPILSIILQAFPSPEALDFGSPDALGAQAVERGGPDVVVDRADRAVVLLVGRDQQDVQRFTPKSRGEQAAAKCRPSSLLL